MRIVPSAVVIACAPLLACNQDAASSNAERDTHMGVVRAAVPAGEVQDQGEASAPAADSGAPALGAPANAPVPAASSGSASVPAPANPVASGVSPAGSNSASAGRGHGEPDAAPKKKNP